MEDKARDNMRQLWQDIVYVCEKHGFDVEKARETMQRFLTTRDIQEKQDIFEFLQLLIESGHDIDAGHPEFSVNWDTRELTWPDGYDTPSAYYGSDITNSGSFASSGDNGASSSPSARGQKRRASASPKALSSGSPAASNRSRSARGSPAHSGSVGSRPPPPAQKPRAGSDHVIDLVSDSD
jgi:hypothetical protein